MQQSTDKLASFGTYGLHVIQYPSLRWGYVGTIPENLCEVKTQKNGLKYTVSKSFDSKQDAINYFNQQYPNP